MSKVITVLAAGLLAAAPASAARAQEVDLYIGAMTWQGNAALVPVEVVNNTGAPQRAMDAVCEFVALGRVLGTDRERVPPLGTGARATVTAMADVGGQLIDAVRCQLLPAGS